MATTRTVIELVGKRVEIRTETFTPLGWACINMKLRPTFCSSMVNLSKWVSARFQASIGV